MRNFENWVGPGVLQSSVQQTSPYKNLRRKGHNLDIFSSLHFVPLTFLKQASLLNAELGHFWPDLIFKQARLPNKLYYWNALLILVLGISSIVLQSGYHYDMTT